MSPNKDISNKRPDKEQASQELNPWLMKRLADRARPFTARPTVGVSMPSLSSYARQQLSHMGESNRRLARQVIERAGWASFMSRALNLSLISRAFDSILRKSTFVPPVWQHMLDLPWFSPRRRKRHSLSEATDVAASGNLSNTISLYNERYSNTLAQTAPDAEEERLSNKADETYPLFTNELFSPPITGMGLINIANDLPHTTPARTLPFQAKKVADTRHSDALNKIVRVTNKEEPFHTTDEAYPAITKNLSSSPATRERISGTNYRLPYQVRVMSIPLMANQTAVNRETRDADDPTSSYGSQSRIKIPGMYEPNDIQKLQHRHGEDAQEKWTKVDWQPQHIHRDQSLSQVLAPMTQRTIQQRRVMETRPRLTGEGTTKAHTSLIRDIYSPPKAIDRGGESSSVIAKPTVLPFVNDMPRDELKRPSQHVMPWTANRLDDLASNSLPTQKAIVGEVSRVPLHKVALKRVAEVNRARMEEPVTHQQRKRVQKEGEVTNMTENNGSLTLSPDLPNLTTTERGSVGRSFSGGHVEHPLVYREPSSIVGSAMQPPPVIKRLARATSLPSQQLSKSVAYTPPSDKTENNRLFRSREYITSSQDYQFARKPALELPVVSSVRPKAEFSIARSDHSEELFRHTSANIPELTYSRNNGRNNGATKIDLTPVARAAETNVLSQAAAPEPGSEGSKEQGVTLDIRALAREIYPLIKRMIMVERERRPTW